MLTAIKAFSQHFSAISRIFRAKRINEPFSILFSHHSQVKCEKWSFHFISKVFSIRQLFFSKFVSYMSDEMTSLTSADKLR